MRRDLTIPTAVGDLLSAAERHDAAAIVFDPEDRMMVCNDVYRHVYRLFDYSTPQTYRSIAFHTARKGLLDDPELKADIEKWLYTAVGFRRRHKRAQYLVHHKSGKTFLAHHQVFDGFGTVAIRYDVSEKLKIGGGRDGFNIPGFDISIGKWSSPSLIRHFDAPTAILSRTCNLIDANELFLSIVGRDNGISIRRDKVSCFSDRENAIFQEAVINKSFPGACGNKFVKVSKKTTKGYYIVSVFPMSPDASEHNPSMHGVSLVSILDPETSILTNIRPLMDVFGLTAVEAKIAALIGEGKDLHEISNENGTTIGTVRNQIKSIFLKVGVNRQSELVRIIHRISKIDSMSMIR